MRGRSVVAVLSVALAAVSTGCTGASPSRQADDSASATSPSGQEAGGCGCRPSPVTRYRGFLPQVEGTGHGATLWGLLMSSNWHKPGAEWGAGYVFTEPGCWDLHAARGKATGDAWIRVVAR